MQRNALTGALLLGFLAGRAVAADPSLSEKLGLLAAAYPDAIERIDGNTLVLRDGVPAVVIDDGRTKSHAEKLAAADIEDSLLQTYPLGACARPPAVDFDPGRIRSEALMKRLYGGSAAVVRQDLVTVDWFGQRLPVTRRHGAAAALKAVAADLSHHAALKRYLSPSAGTFNWRPIAGATTLSVHSFGAAIDLNTGFADYWRWTGKSKGAPGYRNRYPLPIVETFEKHGFIWGGRWYHFDTMHFEYRPEMIAIARAADADACGR
ncbi:M15 family metallopeptidase [Ensifer adhaerens]|uniref:M15 family metallopeptidase n=1 Tax=Ensifer adhaerens TaxID=106592 RepID=UPI001CBC37B8|nr:M15 family metallopeptidase [Ensifer adhaerens]MBZ7921904.1 M15 family metallopeptidase [Ensifer adhaerens]UAX94299.1 M15 family metallopeptidase [Ensifer adhaerens]UAY01934.1 M15 family metallopeptidase [Ensifer adhaerens]UAY09317.1 M15 family metallopeptidase [Ensifer adhaerens]